MTQTILLVAAILAFCVTAFAFYFRGVWFKLGAIAALAIVANGVFFSLDGVKGWPAETPTEIKGTLATVLIVNPSDKTPGAIYIGVFLNKELKWYEYQYPRVAPKTFFIKYSNNRAAEFQKAKEALENGQEVRINGVPSEEGEGTGDPYEGEMVDITTLLGNMLAKIMPKQKDTYQPSPTKQIEIVEPTAPPQKGSNQ